MKSIQLIGAPTDINSSYLKGPAKAPARIRELLRIFQTTTQPKLDQLDQNEYYRLS